MHFLAQPWVLTQIKVEHRRVVFESVIQLCNGLRVEIISAQDETATVIVTFDCAINDSYGLKRKMVV